MMQMTSENTGWTIEDRNQTGSIAFVVKKDGKAWTAFDIQHEKKLHLIVVRSDLTQFQHIHPTMKKDGVWSVAFTPPVNGTYWMYADFVATGEGDHVLRFERIYRERTREAFQPEKLPYQDDFYNLWDGVTRVVDGIDVGMSVERINADTPDGYAVQVNFVMRDAKGQNLVLEPYLGANGHNVWISTTGEYIHSHPVEYVGYKKGDWPVFMVDLNPKKSYRTFTEFKVKGVLHTAVFDWPFAK
jgi:hypothetical protein